MTELSQRLADVHISTISLFVIVLTVIRLLLIRRNSSFARAIVEMADAALFASVLMFMIVLPFLVKSFYIPSGSMRPTLVDDDHILVNKFLYRAKTPQRGDVVVFTAPDQALATAAEHPDPGGAPTDYIKRLIGLPGDIVEVHAGVVKLGPVGSQQIKTHQDVRSILQILDNDRQHVKFEPDGVEIWDGSSSTPQRIDKDQLADKLGFAGQPIEIDPGYVVRNGKRLNEPYIAEDPEYDLKVVNGESLIRDDRGVHVDGQDFEGGYRGFIAAQSNPIPPGEVMVFGDNRNDSNDSSRWGPLEQNRLVGRAFLIFFPFDRVGVIR
ncbi:MAG: signal peptidase I [Capsulimonadaceae bacterium]|nr:signal peptidase I [Capsulimonadaceae bacterium]